MGGIGVQLDFEPGGKANLCEWILPIWDVVAAFIRGRVWAPYIIEAYVADLKHEAVGESRRERDDKCPVPGHGLPTRNVRQECYLLPQSR